MAHNHTSGWSDFFKAEKQKPYFSILKNQVEAAYQTKTCFPDKKDIFHVLKLIEPDKIKVIIIGQDPYHTPGVADGIAFSSKAQNGKIPPSLRNIFLELKIDYSFNHNKNPSLVEWVKQGVFLINTVWTVEAHKPNSHFHFGWQEFTYNLIDYLINNYRPIILVLWGRQSQCLCENFNSIFKIKSGHPSPLSYHLFKDTRPFSQINSILNKKKLTTIKWEK